MTHNGALFIKDTTKEKQTNATAGLAGHISGLIPVVGIVEKDEATHFLVHQVHLRITTGVVTKSSIIG